MPVFDDPQSPGSLVHSVVQLPSLHGAHVEAHLLDLEGYHEQFVAFVLVR